MFKGLAGHLKDKNVHSINALPSNNIELFDCYAGLTLGHLYRNFPLPITLHFDGMSGVAFYEVVLTSNGLLTLRAFPEGSDTGPTLGDKLSHCIKDQHTAELRALMAQALSLSSRTLSPMTRSGI